MIDTLFATLQLVCDIVLAAGLLRAGLACAAALSGNHEGR